MDVDQVREKCERAGQGHLLQFWNQLDDDEKLSLVSQIDGINLQDICQKLHSAVQSIKSLQKIDDLLEPLPSDVYSSVSTRTDDVIQDCRSIGLKAIANQEVAVVLMAGGQGTRLGISYPKGMFNVGLPSRKSLFQLLAERLVKVAQLAEQATGVSCCVPLYIMTSEETHETTEIYFHENNYFGLRRENVILFQQRSLPSFDLEGKIILKEKSKISFSPGGNGMLYQALRENRLLEDMTSRNVKYVHVYPVDNILIKMADPVYTGYCISENLALGEKFVEKKSPDELVGVICKANGIYRVVHYMEMSKESAELRAENGKLLYNVGNTCNLFFSLEFLKQMCLEENESKLKLHIAKKKIPFIDSSGKVQMPVSPNGVKLEKFLFDDFDVPQKLGLWEVEREDEFAPLKNADGDPENSPTTCRQAVLNLHRRFNEAAGGMFVHQDGSPFTTQTSDNSSPREELVCEVSPLVSYEGEGLECLVQGKKLVPPVTIELGLDGQVQVKTGQMDDT